MLHLLTHLLRPLQAADGLKSRVVANWRMVRFAASTRRRFAGDPRYSLETVTDGLAARIDHGGADSALLQRICRAYAEAAQQPAAETYRATDWWERVRKRDLRPVMRALRNGDLDALDRMYRNFFRDPCSSGLVGMPFGIPKPVGASMRDVHRRVFLGDCLLRLDHWKEQTDGRFRLRDLAGPGIGNPFGVLMEGTLVETGAEFRHYCAYRVRSLLNPGAATVAEVGGGFGGMAYYLLRDRPGVKYFDFDVPESLALTAWYLGKAFPHLSLLLFGEETLTPEAIARADVVLMPLSEMPAMPAESADVTCSSYAISAVAPALAGVYLRDIARMTRCAFLYIGNDRTGRSISELTGQSTDRLTLAETSPVGWHDHIAPNARHVECLFRKGSRPGTTSPT